MTLKELFLKEARQGFRVEISVSGRQDTITGTIVELDHDICRIKTLSGAPWVGLDSITSYDILEEAELANNVSSAIENNLERSIDFAPSVQPKSIKALMGILELPSPDDFDIVDWTGIYEELMETDSSIELKREVDSIRSTFKNITKQLGQMPPKDLETRMHNLRAKALTLRQKYPHASRELYCMVAAMHFITKNYEEALTYFEKGNDKYSAVYAAYRGGSTAKFTQYIDQYITNPSVYDPFLYKLYADNCINTLDITALCNRTRNLREKHTLSEEEKNTLYCLCAAGLRIAQVLGLSIAWAMKCERGEEFECIDSLIKSLPDSWKKTVVGQTNNDVSEQSTNTLFKATICTFNNDGLYGWINGRPNNHFFHITQVNCSDILRHILARPDMAKGLEVTYRLGVPKKSNHDTAAYDIRLTERGVSEATKRLEKNHAQKTVATEIVGYLQEFRYNFGKVYVEGEPYNVIENQITDPYLKGYLAITSHPDIRVVFSPATDRKGKRIAKNVRIDDSTIHFSDADINEMLQSRAVTQAELDQWKNRKDATIVEIREPVFEDLYRFPYIELEPVKTVTTKTADSTPVHKYTEEPSVVVSASATKKSATELPELEPLPLPKENRFTKLPIIAPDRNYYEEAHKYLIEGNLEKAEELYIHALCARDRTESAVADMATQIFLRGDTSRIAEAYQVVDAFKDFIPREKEIILKIQICQKTKERPYQILLCHLISEHVSISEKANTKLHFLSVQGKTLRDLGEYQMALTSFSRWHQIYENEKQYRGQSAVSQYANALNYIKTGEAVCYYLLGDQVRAKNMAKEVLRISSDNATAQSILDDTINMQNTDEFLAPVTEDEYRLDSIQISDFAKTQLTSAPVSIYVKKNVENGKYTGSARDASMVIRMLQDMPGKTPAMRRDILRVAANIVSQQQAQATPDDHRILKKLHLTESDQRKYIARSMAAFGDAILEECGDTDSARYGFLQAIELLDSSEEDYIRSMKHYIESFYNAQQEMAQIVRNDLSVRKGKFNFAILRMQTPTDSDEFVLGLFELCRTLKKTHLTTQADLIHVMSESRTKEIWEQWFSKLSQNQFTGSFKQKLERAEEEYTQFYMLLSNYVEQLPSQFFSQHSSKALACEFEDATQSVFLSMTDKNRVRTLQTIVQNFSGYFTTVQFQYRINLLQTTENDILKLIKVISGQPTKFSYDILLPNLQKIHASLQQAIETQYHKLHPDISISTADIGAYIGVNNEVNLHLVISNGGITSRGNERQMADNISIEITKISEGAEYLRTDTDFTGGIFGGEEAEVILVFRITDPKVLLYGIDLSLRCAYRYNESRTVTKDEHIDYSDTIVVRRGSRSKIKNPFAAHIGKEMNDPHMFKGREQLIQKVTRAMFVGSGYNYGTGFLFYGQTRAGKSSVRVHLRNRIRANFPEVILVDLGNLDPNSFEEKAFYCKLLFGIDQELQRNHRALFAELCDDGLRSPSDSIVTLDIETVRIKFERYLGSLSQEIMGKTMIVVLADEFSAINSAIKVGRVSENFMQSWKAMLENYGIFTVCFGQDDSPGFIAQNGNAFDRMNVAMITYLEKPYAIELIENPLMVYSDDGTEKSRYSPSVVEEIYRLTSGSAYLIIKLCSLLVDYLNEKGAEYVTPGILQRFIKSRVFVGQDIIDEGDFEPQLGDRSDPALYPLNTRILLRIARSAQSTGWADIEHLSDADLNPRDGQTPQQRKNELLRILRERDVIEIAEGRRCRIKVALLNHWLLMKYGTEG